MSKANQAFAQNDEAVSPVIGVILMVAITVVLAAVVFVLVSNLSGGGEDNPEIGFSKNSGAGTLTVVSVNFDGPVAWADIDVNGCTQPTTGDVTAGDQLTSCSGDVTVSYTPNNALIYDTTF